MNAENTPGMPPSSFTGQANVDLNSLDSYYQQEFKKIIESNETYKGKWNWYAFFFTNLWLLTKRAWIYAIIITLSVVLTTSFKIYILIVLGWCLLMGWRGTWIYYNVKIKKKQFMKSLF